MLLVSIVSVLSVGCFVARSLMYCLLVARSVLVYCLLVAWWLDTGREGQVMRPLRASIYPVMLYVG